MTDIRYASMEDKKFWFSIDKHLSGSEYEHKVNRKQCYIIEYEGKPAGLLRYNLFWDTIPFCTLIFIKEEYRSTGFGRSLLEHWENDMRQAGYGMVLTSTQVDEDAQNFYRIEGYKDCGGLIINIPMYEQPMELFLAKEL